jgi:hypothetical protein
MSAVTIQQMADRVAGLMEERLRVRGTGLAEKLKKGGRLLPRKVRLQAESLAQAAALAQNPKLMLQLDQAAVAQSYDVCLRHLGGVNAWERRKGAILGIAASVGASVLVVGLLLLVVLRWRGFM